MSKKRLHPDDLCQLEKRLRGQRTAIIVPHDPLPTEELGPQGPNDCEQCQDDCDCYNVYCSQFALNMLERLLIPELANVITTFIDYTELVRGELELMMQRAYPDWLPLFYRSPGNNPWHSSLDIYTGYTHAEVALRFVDKGDALRKGHEKCADRLSCWIYINHNVGKFRNLGTDDYPPGPLEAEAIVWNFLRHLFDNEGAPETHRILTPCHFI